MLSIDHQSPIPLHSQVETLLRQLVLQPEYQKGELLPDEVSLATRLGVSRGTVRSGISKLVFEGVLNRRAGIGTRVTKRPMESGITAWRSFTMEMAAKGVTVKNFRLEYGLVPATITVAEALQIEAEAKVWRLDRVRGWQGKPVLQSISWFHPRLCLKGTEDFSRPLYEVLETATGIRPHHAHEEFLAVSANARLAKLLQVGLHRPLLLRRHTVFDPGDRPFEIAEVRYVSSRFALTVDVRRGDQ